MGRRRLARRDAALEFLGLKWADVDLTAGRLMVRGTVWRDLECLPKGRAGP